MISYATSVTGVNFERMERSQARLESLASVLHGLAPPRPVPAVRMERTACPLCDADDAERVFVGRDHNFGFAGEFPVERCRRCGLLYSNPYVTPDCLHAFFDADYQAHDPSATTDSPGVTRRPARRRAADDVVRPFGQARLLDLGCGNGRFMARMRAAGWSVLGVEPIARGIESCRAAGLDAIQGTIPSVDLAGRRFELITMRGVLPALPDPRATLSELRRHVTDDGRLMANLFAADSLMARWTGPHWLGFDLPRQRCHYTRVTLARLLESTGWRIERAWFARRPNLVRRNVRLMALVTGRAGWRMAARVRVIPSLIATVGAWLAKSDEVHAIARPVEPPRR